LSSPDWGSGWWNARRGLEFPWAAPDGTTLVRHPSGEVQWWTFAGGLANTLLGDYLAGGMQPKADNLRIRFPAIWKLADAETLIRSRLREDIVPRPGEQAIKNLKFGECLPPSIAGEVFAARFSDPEAIAIIRQEPMRAMVVGESRNRSVTKSTEVDE
jgi:ATP-dependent Lhr-like helicase